VLPFELSGPIQVVAALVLLGVVSAGVWLALRPERKHPDGDEG
jgi:hypothetical protein